MSWKTEYSLPIAFTTTLLLGVAWILAGVASLGKVTWKMLLWSGCAIGKALMIAVVGLMRTSHCIEALLVSPHFHLSALVTH